MELFNEGKFCGWTEWASMSRCEFYSRGPRPRFFLTELLFSFICLRRALSCSSKCCPRFFCSSVGSVVRAEAEADKTKAWSCVRDQVCGLPWMRASHRSCLAATTDDVIEPLTLARHSSMF